ncbi:ArdC-like ssDNA-binding domain-containing protein [Planococcus lenghuensis]|uniref:LtrC-like protein n=1 Tax=Planococcus lenghuensis TaxID=2213202 RepID=A0A1Q2L582_9BACL|nr:ArdC-like ssDNA-binding domain-containing protein [Planococcus lenghuensis]AQQ55576.1 LtrC-like protein [Planococcus lenghuensis]
MSKKLDLTDINKRLEENLEAMFRDNRFQEMLDVMASGHQYSFNNVLMIVSQHPDATMVRGFRQWQELGRHVNKGEKGIDIFVPLFKKIETQKVNQQTGEILRDANGDPQTEIRQSINGFTVGKVFDISQTDGKDIPNVREFVQNDLKSTESLTELYERFIDSVNQNDVTPLTIQEEAHDGKGYGGYYNQMTNEIVINTAVSQTAEQKFRVLIHEYAHSQLHHRESELKELPRGHKEAQAECTAYIVSQYYGFDTSLSSTGYIATWAQDLDLAKQAIQEVQSTSRVMIEQLNSLQQEKINEFYQSINPEKVKEDLEAKFGFSFEDNPTLQLADTKNGLVVYGTIEQSERDQHYFLRTNTNRIVPIQDIGERYGVLNVLENNKELVTDYRKVEDVLEVTKLDEGTYAVTLEGGDTSQRTFQKKAEADQFIQKTGLAQSLNTDRFLSKSSHPEKARLHQVNVQHLNQRLGNVLNEKDLKAEHRAGVTLGWYLVKNPRIQSKAELGKQLEQANDKNAQMVRTKEAFQQLGSAVKDKEQELERE